jgi:hypothetical protein
MDYVFICIIGVIGGGFCVFIALDARRRMVQMQKRQQDTKEERLRSNIESIKAKQQELIQEAQRVHSELDHERQRVNQELAQEVQRVRAELKAQELAVHQQSAQLKTEQAQFEARAISYNELQMESAVLKRDLRNLDLNVRKLNLDRESQRQNQETLDQRSNELGKLYLKDNVKWIGTSLNANNFTNCKQRLLDAIEKCREIGFGISTTEQAVLLADLKREYEMAVRVAFEREEQARIKAQIREEQLREKEIERELKQLDREREAIKAALERALAEAEGQHSAEVERLQARLKEAEEKAQRAISQAQLTKAGHVYVISNIGSFGEGVYKIGMTRRLEPMERVYELSAASVPFPFDVHMMISCDNAPTLENALHRAFFKARINKTNPRKEFFKTDIEAIRKIVKEHHGEVDYIADAEALQYRQSLTMSDDDQEFIESVYDKLEEDGDLIAGEV